MKIIISCDHAGYEIKHGLIEYLKGKGHDVSDMGPSKYNAKDDYPDFIIPSIKKLTNEPKTKGILMCRNGVGASMLANKFKGVRAALSFNKTHVKSARYDDDINVLCLPTDYLSDEEILEIVDTFLETPFSDLERHKRRLEKVKLEEKINFAK